MADETKTSAQSMARQILNQLESTTPAHMAQARSSSTEASPPISAATADELIALYFACEDADERDIVFERLVALEPLQTRAFFDAMMRDDEDEFMRVAAATVLVERGDVAAIAVLLEQMQSGGDVTLFEQALAGLLQVPGLALYPVLVAIWHDSGREPAERRAAMLGMELLDAEQASLAMVSFVDDLRNLRRFADDQLEVAMAMLARQPLPAGLAALERLAARIEAMACADTDAAEDQRELLAFVNEGVTLVRSALAPA